MHLLQKKKKRKLNLSQNIIVKVQKNAFSKIKTSNILP